MLYQNLPLLRICAATALVFTLACAEGEVAETGDGPSTTSASGGQGGTAGAGGMASGGSGGDPGLCGTDCSLIQTPECMQSVCNEGQYPGAVGSCVVVPAPPTVTCDDGQFCTVDDHCQDGQCVGGPPNDCGMTAAECEEVVCDEDADACTTQAANDGTSCTPTDPCILGATCQAGQCDGYPNDCFFAPVPDCEIAVCDSTTGMCVGQVDPNKEGQPCNFGGDLCMVDKTCQSGQCIGGTPKDCSQLDMGCVNGVCDPMNGACVTQAVPAGGQCNSGNDQCNVGICDSMQTCVPTPVMNGTPCQDFNSCTLNDVCTGGLCAGTVDPNCTVYFEDNFENGCPSGGWILNPEWECGVPTNVGPTAAYQGTSVLGTDLDDEYENSHAYTTSFAETVPINLGLATDPTLSYWHWIDTEGSTYDGYHLEISNDGGQTFSLLTTVDPPYNLTVGGQPAWGGHEQVWNNVVANLAAFAGQTVILRWAFRSDGSIVYPGIYVDDVLLGEGSDVPITITSLALPDAYVGAPYAFTVERVGGSSSATWSIVGGSNHAWLTINPTTGVLSGTPTTSELGPVTVTVRAEEPSNPSNFDEATYTFLVRSVLFLESFDGTCPNGWTLSGEWQCGAPTSGPGAALSGTQCIATILGGDYNNGAGWSTNHASSPAINLSGTTAPELAFWVWYDTESNYDGFNVQVSTDGGVTYSVVQNVTPPYSGTLDGLSAWYGDQSSVGWQEHTANLSAYAGMTIHLRIGFRSDGSVVNPGVYIDDLTVAD